MGISGSQELKPPLERFFLLIESLDIGSILDQRQSWVWQVNSYEFSLRSREDECFVVILVWGKQSCVDTFLFLE